MSIIFRLAISTNYTHFLPDGGLYKVQLTRLTSIPNFYDQWGVGSEDNTTKKEIISLIIQASRVSAKYSRVDSESTCRSAEKSFYWDFQPQTLYINFPLSINPASVAILAGVASGYTDSKGVIYIDDIEYLPLILSVPSIAQKASIVDYKLQAYVNGTVSLANAGRGKGLPGPMDFLIDENVYGNDADLFYLDDADIVTDGKIKSVTKFRDVIQEVLTGADTIQETLLGQIIQESLNPVSVLIPLASFFIEDYNFSLEEVPIKVQDKRKAENPTIPTAVFTVADYPDIESKYIDNVIPPAFGLIREIPCTPTNGEDTGAVDFRAADSLTSFGTIQVLIDDVWTTKTATASTLSTGSFTLSSANARETSGAVRKVKLVGAIGIAVAYASDVIKALNLEYLGIPFTSSFYDLTEWAAEEVGLTTIGIPLDKERKLSDWIKDIQAGANIRFRYEVNPEGLRTIRIRDNNRASAGLIPNVSIFNKSILPVSTDSDTVFAEVKVQYAKSYQEDKYLSVLNDDYFDTVLQNYRQRDRLTVPTFLTTEAHAEERAANDALDFSEIRGNASIQAVGADQLSWKIFQTVTAEITPGFADADNDTIEGREYFGVRDAIILAIDPDGSSKTNRLTLRLL